MERIWHFVCDCSVSANPNCSNNGAIFHGITSASSYDEAKQKVIEHYSKQFKDIDVCTLQVIDFGKTALIETYYLYR